MTIIDLVIGEIMLVVFGLSALYYIKKTSIENPGYKFLLIYFAGGNILLVLFFFLLEKQ
jgi:hypothetical protein